MRKAKVALVGLGSWGSTQSLPAINEAGNLELVSWFDSNPEVVEQYRSLISVPPARSFEELLDNPDIEGIILIVPNHVHAPLAIQAAGRGKHVWVEKPIANTVDEADQMIEAAENAGVTLQVGHSLRRAPGMRIIKKAIEEGKIGEVALIEAHQSHRGGWSLVPGVWRWYVDKCPGGPLNLLGIHQIDIFHYLVGAVDEVMALTGKKFLECETEEITEVIMRFKNGALGQIGDTYVTPPKTLTAIYGTEGWFEFDFWQYKLTYYDIEGKPEVTQVQRVNLIADEFREFGECILTGRQPETGGPEGRAAVAVLEAALESARTGRSVKL